MSTTPSRFIGLTRFLLQAGLCIVAAYVALLPRFYLVYEVGNRYALDWSSRYRASILLAILLLAAVYGLLYSVLRLGAGFLDRMQSKVDCRRCAFDLAIWILTALVFRSLMATAYATDEMPAAAAHFIDMPVVKLLCYLFLPAGLLLIWRRAYERFVLNLYRVLAVLFALFLVQMYTWEVYASSDSVADIPTDRKEGAPNSLFIFLFDEWSYDASFGDPRFSLTHMPHLQELLGHATLFREAYSPGVATTVSIPRFLCQGDERVNDYSYAELETRIEQNQFLSLGLETIFDFSDRHYAFISGIYLHYPGIVGKSVDCVIPFDDPNARNSLWDCIWSLLHSQVVFLKKFGLAIPPQSHSPFEFQGWEFLSMEAQVRIRPVLNDILPRLPAESIAFFHIYLPHPPYLFLRDWTRRTPPIFGGEGNVELYHENVYAVDAVIGDIVSQLKARGDYESSLLVITSDHSWKAQYSGSWEELDTKGNIPEKHVPLIIKYPGQVRGGETGGTISTADLHPLFRDYLTAPDQVRGWVSRWNAEEETNAWYSPK